MRYPEVRLNRGADRTLLNGHPWVFSGAVAQAPQDAAPGQVVDVHNHRGRFVVRGFYNPHSAIRVRALTQERTQAVDRAFFATAIRRALEVRRRSGLEQRTNAMRLVHGESDGLPGLVVDRYAGYLVVQFHTSGMEGVRTDIIDVLEEEVHPLGLYERSDVGTRRAEGLPDRPTGLLRGQAPPELVEIHEDGVPLVVDLYRGQKTGFFLDQRDNRAALQRLSGGQSLLNCFAYSSAFSAHALYGGAARTLDVDVAPEALPAARLNLSRNCGPQAHWDYVIASVFPLLDELAERGPRFDIVVLDPPSLVRKQRQAEQALGVYTMLNRNALRLVRTGGLLVTASCSTRVSAEDFFQVVRHAAVGARVHVRITASTFQPADHPVDPAFPEGRYLKCIFARVLR
ncbi:MAG: class I SAM-dependent rRNA methyltransferase [Candidatus Latescibacterota bacterium]